MTPLDPPENPPEQHPSEQLDPQQEMVATEWLQPPPLALGMIIPMNRIVARTQKGAISLVEARAYTSGCWLEVMAAVMQPTEATARQRIWQVLAGINRNADAFPKELVRFGVRYADGTTATTLRRLRHSERTGARRPEPPVLVVRSGRATEAPRGKWLQIVFGLWLWPLPPAEGFEFTVEYPLIELPETGTSLDGSIIVAAASRSSMLVDY